MKGVPAFRPEAVAGHERGRPRLDVGLPRIPRRPILLLLTATIAVAVLVVAARVPTTVSLTVVRAPAGAATVVAVTDAGQGGGGQIRSGQSAMARDQPERPLRVTSVHTVSDPALWADAGLPPGMRMPATVVELESTMHSVTPIAGPTLVEVGNEPLLDRLLR